MSTHLAVRLLTTKNFLFIATTAICWMYALSSGHAQSPKSYLDFLVFMMDRYHQTYNVYTDSSSGGNHFNERALIGAANSDMDGSYTGYGAGETIKPYAGKTAIRAYYNWKSSPGADPITGYLFSGWYFINGVLQGENIVPQLNLGTIPDAGIDLTGARTLTFWARGDQGGEVVDFLAQGVGRDAESGAAVESYPESAVVTKKKVTLTNQWQPYTLDVGGKDLSYVLGGFGWVASQDDNQHLNRDVVFYIDEISYDLPRLNEPRFLTSFNNVPNEYQIGPDDFDLVLENVAYSYDNALALVAFVATGEMERAELIADAFVYALHNDRYYGRGFGAGDSNPFNDDPVLRNAYQSGDLALPPGWEPRGLRGVVRLPGWWDPDAGMAGTWFEDLFAVSTHTGNVAWPVLALLTYYQSLHGNDYVAGDPYLDTAVTLAQWIESKLQDARGPGGYIGGIQGWAEWVEDPYYAGLPDGHPYKQLYGNGPKPLTYKATEHNLDLYACFARLHQIFSADDGSAGNPAYIGEWFARASYAANFVGAMWNPTGQHFWTGTRLDGVTRADNPSTDIIPLDVQPWSILSLRLGAAYWPGLDFAEQHNGYYDNGQFTWGFDFNNKEAVPFYPDPPLEYQGETDGIWFEGTGQMATAYGYVGDGTKVSNVLNTIETYGKAESGGVWAVYAHPRDRITTGFTYTAATDAGLTEEPWLYFRKQHVGATAWAIFAEMGVNPFWVGTDSRRLAP